MASLAVTTADLMVKAFYWEKSGLKARQITAWIANEGVAPARDVDVTIHSDSAQGQVLKSFTIPVIDPGASEKLSWDWDISDTEFSTPEITLYVVVDPNQRVTESNEKNNTSQCVVNVSKKANIPGKGTVGNGGLTSTRERWLSHSGALAGQPHGDTNHDGRIDVKDLSVLAKDWLREAPWHTD